MRITLITVPYDLGRADVGSGRGPGAYLQAGAAEALRGRGHDVSVVTVKRSGPFDDEIQAVLDVDAIIADEVAGAVQDESLPLVLAGNCNAALGVRAGLQHAFGLPDRDVLVWLDAHGDFNTPSTTQTGYLDGMPLAMMCGRAHRMACASALGLEPFPEQLVLHAGGRDIDTAEAAQLASSSVDVVSSADLLTHGITSRLDPALDRLARRAPVVVSGRRLQERPGAHLHVDIDILDPSAAPGVMFPSPGGLSSAQLLEVIDLVLARFELRAVTLSSFSPEHDDASGSTLASGLAVLWRVAGDS